MKAIVKRIFNQLGYDINLAPIASKPYSGTNIAFVHMAKCGGMSVDYALRKALAQPKQPRISRDFTLAASVASFRKAITSIEESMEFSEHHAKNLTQLFDYYLAKNWRYVSGHVTTDSALLAKYQDNYHFVTVLRNPVDRFVSNYLYNKKTNVNAFMLPNVHTTDGLIDEAKAIISSKRGWQMANTMTMFLTGRYPKDAQDAKQMHHEVSANLAKYSVVGFLDDLPRFTQQIAQLTGRKIDIEKRNQGKNAGASNLATLGCDYLASLNDLEEFLKSNACQKQISELCKYELMNYDNAKESAL